MKILKLRLLNLNSLSGEWIIDFTGPEFSDGGLFAITGPTGVGKTTILDGICLALYGRTPRLPRVNKTTNEIMSRGRGECAAELIFETPAGRWRSHWSQRRANKKPGGALQAPRHEIVDDQSDQVIESSLTKTLARVEQTTGMTFEQFTRSMMLAQGAFAAFLEAPADDRADLLEQITGADIYTAISIKTHERRNEERKKLETWQGELKGLSLSGDDQKNLEEEEKRQQIRLREIDAALASGREAWSWLTTLAELEAERLKLLDKEKQLAGQREKFLPQAEQLTRAQEAGRLDAPHGSLRLLRQKRDQAAEDLSKRRPQLPALESDLAAGIKAAALAAERLEAARRTEEAARPLLTAVRALDVRRLEAEKRLAPLEAERQAVWAELAKLLEVSLPLDGEAQMILSRRADELKSGLAGRGGRLAAGRLRVKELLAGREPGYFRDQIITLTRRSDLLAEFTGELKRRAVLEKEISANDDRRRRAAGELAAVVNDLKLQTERVSALETDAERLAAIWDLQLQLRSFDDWRQNLEDGRACPLCGAVDHPYAVPGNIPSEKVSQDMIKENRAALKAGKDRLNVLTAKDSSLKQFLKSEESAAERLAAEFKGLADWQSPRFARLEMAPEEDEPLPALAARQAETTGKSLAAAAGVIRELETLEKKLAAEEAAVKRETGVVERADRLFQAAGAHRAALESLRRQADELARERSALFSDRQPDKEDQKLRADIAAAENQLSQETKKRGQAEAGREKLKALIEETEARLKELDSEIKAHEETFRGRLLAAGFPDEAVWQAARLSDADRAGLEKTGRELSEAQAVLISHQAANAERRAREVGRNLTARTLPEISTELETLEGERRERQAGLGAVQQNRADSRLAAERHRRLLSEAEAQSLECRRWDQLHELIGSADGRKYRNFAQSLTFEALVGQANRQLVRLSDRYLLVRDEDQPLELKVIDNYQAGEIRSAKNLSGGESFLVSLALALGLSQMASRRVRVDSLFLDEGFGTLDEDALDSALETLAGLREEGKLIGVISHIPALMNRIGVQIKVRPQNGPHSEITGPGVSRGLNSSTGI